MTQHLTIQQLNNLRIGNSLAADIPAVLPDHRAFVVIGAYVPGSDDPTWGHEPPRALNSPSQANLRFWLRRYEVAQWQIEQGWDVAESDLHRQTHQRGIASVEEVERELEKYLDDFSLLDVSWRRDNPV